MELALHPAHLGVGLAQSLLRPAHHVLTVLVGNGAHLLGLLVGLGHHLAGLLAGHCHHLGLADQAAGLVLRPLLQLLGLTLGAGEQLVAVVEHLAGLGQLHGQLGLGVLDEVQGLVPLDDALFRAQRRIAGLVHHIKQHIQQFFHRSCHR